MLKQNKKHTPDNNALLEALVVKAIKGDRQALSDLCDKIAKGVLFQVMHLLGPNSGIEDIAQEVLIRVCENIHKLRDPKTFKGWLARIVVNEKNRFLSKYIKHNDVLNINDYLENVTESEGAVIPHKYIEDEEIRNAVMEVVSGLPMRQKEVILLHYYNGLSVKEVAAAMNITTQSVSKQLSIAREKLKNKLSVSSSFDGYNDAFNRHLP